MSCSTRTWLLDSFWAHVK